MALPEAERRETLVAPFYLYMMRLNACTYGEELLPAIAAAARTAAPIDIVYLLRSFWRESVVGAWMSLLFDDEQITDALLVALSRSAGSLTSPPLAVAAIVLAGSRAVEALAAYAAKDRHQDLGACGFVAAALEHLGAPCESCSPSERDRHSFASMLALAHALREMRAA